MSRYSNTSESKHYIQTKKIFTLLALICCCGLTSQKIAYSEAMTVEIIRLHNRPASDIAPIIKPMLPPGGSVSAYQSKLIVKTTPQSFSQIKQLVKKLDTPLKQLTVRVRQGATNKQEQTGLIGPIPIIRSSASGLSETLQHIKVLDGSRAMIQIGKLFPYVTYYFTQQGFIRPGITYVDDTTGFYVRPRVIGKAVQVEISTKQKTMSQSHSGVISAEHVQTTLQAPLGEWVAIGGTSKKKQYRNYFIFFGTKGYRDIDTAVFVKVDMAD